jgi:hypothetical protein
MSMNIETVEELVEYRTVQIWLKGVRDQSSASTTPDERRLSTLYQFCLLVEKEPDVMIEECFRAQKEGDEWKHIKFKVRRSYMELISHAEIELYGGGTTGRHHGSIIRSFFIHNGVSMQAEPLR